MEQKKLFDLLSQNCFRIPDYQRGYAWGDRQRTDLWEDMENMMPKGNLFKPHYTGCLYADKIPDESIPKEEAYVISDYYYLVDGQQRMTTLAIILFELLKYGQIHDEHYQHQKASFWKRSLLCFTKDDGSCPVYKFSYEDSEYKSFLEHVIFEDKAIIRKEYEEINSCYKQNLFNAKLFFQDKIAQLDSKGREAVFVKLLFCMPMDFNPIEKEFDVQAVFETMNNRGKPLTNLEKLKNRLMYLSANLTSVDNEQRINLRRTINTAWGIIYKNLGRKDAPLSEDEFLSAHLSLIKTPKYNGAFPDDEAGEKVFTMFCLHPDKWEESPITMESIEKYSNQLADFSHYWREIHDTSEIYVKKSLILSNTKEVKIFLAVAYLLRNQGKSIENMLIATEKILFRNTLPGTSVMDIRGFVTNAKNLYNNITDVTIDSVTSELETAAKGYDLMAVCNRFVDLFNYVRGGVGFHRWNGLKYLLFEYEEKLRIEHNKQKKDSQPPRIQLDEYADTQIEHVLPQHWEEHWQETIKDYDSSLQQYDFLKGKSFDIEKSRKLLINSLGNLTILRGGKNAHVSNDSWKDKQEAYKGSSFSEIDIAEEITPGGVAKERNQWTQTEIMKRGKQIFSFLLEKIEYDGDLKDFSNTLLPLNLLVIA